jgi:hypothetical protein
MPHGNALMQALLANSQTIRAASATLILLVVSIDTPGFSFFAIDG